MREHGPWCNGYSLNGCACQGSLAEQPAPTPAGQERADRSEANGPNSVESLIRWMLNTVDPLQSGVEVRAQCVALARRLADRSEADLIERVARAMHETPPPKPGVYGRIPWDRLPEAGRDAYRRMAAAAVEVLRGETR